MKGKKEVLGSHKPLQRLAPSDQKTSHWAQILMVLSSPNSTKLGFNL